MKQELNLEKQMHQIVASVEMYVKKEKFVVMENA
jgi:hypothetical protein